MLTAMANLQDDLWSLDSFSRFFLVFEAKMSSKNANRKAKAEAKQRKDVLERLSTAETNDLDTNLDDMSVSVGIGFEITSLPMLIKCLQHHHNKVEQWARRYPEDSEVRSGVANCKAMLQWLERFRDNEYVNLILQVEGLQKRIEGFNGKMNSMNDKIKAEQELREACLKEEIVKREDLQRRFDEYKTANDKKIADMEEEAAREKSRIEDSAAKEKSLMLTFDLVKMYRHYYVKNVKWYQFTKACAEMVKDIAEGKKTEKEYDQLLQSMQDKLPQTFKLNLKELVKHTLDRHGIVHCAINDVDSQEEFLDMCATYPFRDADVQALASTLISALVAKRDNNELSPIS